MGGRQSRPVDATARRRRRDAPRSFYLVFGEPQIRYTGERRGPLIFHVHTPAQDTSESVDAAETLKCPARLQSATLNWTSDYSTAAAEVSVVHEADCAVRVILGGRLSVSADHGVKIADSRVIHSVQLQRSSPAEDETGQVGATTLQLDRRWLEEAVAATKGSERTKSDLPTANGLCIALDFDVKVSTAGAAAEGQDEREDDEVTTRCTQYHFLANDSLVSRPDNENRRSTLSVQCTLLQRGDRVYRIDNVFDLTSDKPQRADGDGAADADGGDAVEDDDDDGVCIVCIENEKDTVVLPCRHFCMCSECAQAVRNQRGRCPICRCDIERLMRRTQQSP